MYFLSASVQDSSRVKQMKAVVQGADVWQFRTRHISLVLKFFLHFSHTANRESGNLTLSDCLNPGGVNVNTFCSRISSKTVEWDMLQVSHVRTSSFDTYTMRYRLGIHHLLLEARHDMRFRQKRSVRGEALQENLNEISRSIPRHRYNRCESNQVTSCACTNTKDFHPGHAIR